MKIATWNVNSLRVRLPQVLDWLATEQPDVLAVQETKLTDELFPATEIQAAGYQVAFSGQKTYNGVAVLARAALDDPVTAIPGFDDPQRRLLAVTCAGERVVDVYIPNGSEVGSEKYAYKLAWLEHFTRWLEAELQRHPRLVVLGDFNIAPADLDVHDPEAWRDKVLCSAPERAAFQRLVDLGLADSFRRLAPEAREFSWWDYRMNGFRRNLGLRIDHILASPALQQGLNQCVIDKGPRALERPSDHTPVWANFDL